MDLDKALQAHGEWKLKFRMAMQKKQTLDADAIGRDNVCPLGQWLHGEAKAKYAGLKTYGICVDKHACFHREAGTVAATINARQYDRAADMLEAGTSYTMASSAVGGAILGLRKEAGL
jgi:hypothetical protein